MKSYLKVKVCTLAAENKAIKVQQRRWKRSARRAREKDQIAFARANFFGLMAHRVGKGGVQKEARDANLAYGFLRNRPYAKMEAFAYTKPNWDNIEKMVRRFGGEFNLDDLTAPDPRDLMQRFSGWKHEAELHYLTATSVHNLAAKKVKPPHLPGTKRRPQLP